MNIHRRVRALARPLKRMWPEQPDLHSDTEFLSYVLKKKTGLMNRAGEIKTIALGASTTDYAFKPERSEQSYNLGLTSFDLHATYHTYMNIRDGICGLQNVLVFASSFSPGFHLAETRERYRAIAYRYFLGVPIQDEGRFKNRAIRQIEEKCRLSSIGPIGPDYSGYDKKTYFGEDITAADRVRTHLRENLRNPDQMAWLQSLLDEAGRRGHRVYLIIPPFRCDYKEEFSRFISEEDVFRKFYELALGDHRILNYYSSSVFGDECLGDTDHLNEGGARRLTQDIMRRIAEDNC